MLLNKISYIFSQKSPSSEGQLVTDRRNIFTLMRVLLLHDHQTVMV